MAFIKFLLIFVAIYYILKFVFKNIIYNIMTKTMNNLNNKQAHEHEVKPEGEITIQQTQKTGKKLDKSIGEYVDFENLD